MLNCSTDLPGGLAARRTSCGPSASRRTASFAVSTPTVPGAWQRSQHAAGTLWSLGDDAGGRTARSRATGSRGTGAPAPERVAESNWGSSSTRSARRWAGTLRIRPCPSQPGEPMTETAPAPTASDRHRQVHTGCRRRRGGDGNRVHSGPTNASWRHRSSQRGVDPLLRNLSRMPPSAVCVRALPAQKASCLFRTHPDARRGKAAR